MRKTLQLLAVLMAILYCSSAQAAVDPYEALEVTPAEGTVTSLQHFTITFGDLPVVVNNHATPALEKGGGATIEGQMSVASDGKTLLIDFDECFTASGHYYLHLPENSLTVNGQTLLPLTLRFTIDGDAYSFYEQINVDPAEGTMESLQNFTIFFPEYIGDIEYGSMATLRNDNNGKTYRAEMYGVGFKVFVYFPEEVTKGGNYTLTLPANSVIFYGLGFDVHELNFHYTIEGEQEDPFYDQITIDPPEGMTIGLQNFTISFPEIVDGIASGSKATLTNTTSGNTYQTDMVAAGNDVIVNFPNEIVELGDYTLNIPESSLIINAVSAPISELNFLYSIKSLTTEECTINPPEGDVYLLQNFTIDYGTTVEVNENVHPTIVNDDTGETYECNLVKIGHNAFVYKQAPLGVLGNYTLHVPAACIELVEPGTVNPEMNLHYTIIEKDIFIPPVIEDQPEGEVRLYRRTGGVVKEVEKPYVVGEGENPYEIVIAEQEGALSIVYAADNKVYIQHPVSESYYDGWVEGTLSEDGKTITVPMGQYIAYAKSLEMAVQVGIFVFDADADTYVYDSSIEELTYTINDDGTISQDDTDPNIILGTMNRAFGQSFQYLDFEWLQSGDFETVFIPIDEQPQTPPEGMETENYYLTTCIYYGTEWEPYSANVKVGYDGDDMWLQGISEFLPSSWIKGHIDGNTVTFANPQLLGAYEALIYFKAADVNPVNGNTTQKDLVLTIDDENTLYTYDYVFITDNPDELNYVNSYQGLTLSKYPETAIEAPEGLRTYDYAFSFKSPDEAGNLVLQQDTVHVGFAGDRVYIQGLCAYLPESWVEGQLVNGKLVFDLPQYLGVYDDEYEMAYPIYFNGFNQSTGRLNRQVTLNYNSQTRVFSNQSSPIGFGINKTGYLNVQDIYQAVLQPIQTFRPGDVNNDGNVNIADVTILIGFVLSHNATGINLDAADLNGDGQYDISDVTSLISLVLRGGV